MNSCQGGSGTCGRECRACVAVAVAVVVPEEFANLQSAYAPFESPASVQALQQQLQVSGYASLFPADCCPEADDGASTPAACPAHFPPDSPCWPQAGTQSDELDSSPSVPPVSESPLANAKPSMLKLLALEGEDAGEAFQLQDADEAVEKTGEKTTDAIAMSIQANEPASSDLQDAATAKVDEERDCALGLEAERVPATMLYPQQQVLVFLLQVLEDEILGHRRGASLVQEYWTEREATPLRWTQALALSPWSVLRFQTPASQTPLHS